MISETDPPSAARFMGTSQDMKNMIALISGFFRYRAGDRKGLPMERAEGSLPGRCGGHTTTQGTVFTRNIGLDSLGVFSCAIGFSEGTGPG